MFANSVWTRVRGETEPEWLNTILACSHTSSYGRRNNIGPTPHTKSTRSQNQMAGHFGTYTNKRLNITTAETNVYFYYRHCVDSIRKNTRRSSPVPPILQVCCFLDMWQLLTAIKLSKVNSKSLHQKHFWLAELYRSKNTNKTCRRNRSIEQYPVTMTLLVCLLKWVRLYQFVV